MKKLKINGNSKPQINSNLTSTVANVLIDIAANVVTTAISNKINNSPKHTHGPVVKTGPTAGKNRSRNKNGQWRAKRSDAGIKRK